MKRGAKLIPGISAYRPVRKRGTELNPGICIVSHEDYEVHPLNCRDYSPVLCLLQRSMYSEASISGKHLAIYQCYNCRLD